MMAVSSTVLVIGPTWSSDQDSGITPRMLTRPYVGFNPTMPQYEAGIRTEPAVSVPSDAKHWAAATAAPGPPDDPPGVSVGSHGLCTGPKNVTAEVPPYANSWRFSFPSRTAPAALSLRTTSASSVGMRSLKSSLAPVV